MIKEQIARIKDKLGVERAADITRLAVRHGVLQA